MNSPDTSRKRERTLEIYTHRCLKATVIGLSRIGCSAMKISSDVVASMCKELVRIGIDAQKAVGPNQAPIDADAIVRQYSATQIESEIRRFADDETAKLVEAYRQVRFVNMKIDAGSVLRSHCTHALIDTSLDSLVPWILPVSENNHWDTSDYETFLVQHLDSVKVLAPELVVWN